MLVRLLGVEEAAPLTGFSDVPEDAWYAGAMQKAVAAGLIKGSSGLLRPLEYVTRQEAFVMLARAFGLSGGDPAVLSDYLDSDAVADWAMPSVAALAAADSLSASGARLRPMVNITRAELAHVLYKLSAPEAAVSPLDGLHIAVSAPDCRPADPTITVTATFSGLPEDFSRRCTLTWYIDGMPVKTDASFLLTPAATASCSYSYIFSASMQISSKITLAVTLNGETCLGSEEIALENYAASYYEALAEKSAPYRIDVLRSQNVVLVYGQDAQGAYTVLQNAFLCSTGYATPLGSYQSSEQYRWRTLFGSASSNYQYVYGQYSTRITGNILFHSVPYFSQNQDDLEYAQYNLLGTKASMGCIRLTVTAAKWIYDNCPAGTTVRIYDADSIPVTRPVAPRLDTASPNRGWDPTDPDTRNPWLAGA